MIYIGCLDSLIQLLEKTLFYLKKERSKSVHDEEYMMV